MTLNDNSNQENSKQNTTCQDNKKNILVAVAWPYANGPRHIGHVAGFAIPSDVFSRYMRLKGHNVLMVSGTDEHGTPILVQADEAGISPQELADKYNKVIVDDLVNLGITYDMFTRTTTNNHHKVVQEMFKTIYNNGYMIKKTMLTAISPTTKRALPDRYVEGTCPICKYDNARGDQCDNCGNQLDPNELINPKSKINGETPEFVETEHFFLDIPAMADALKNWLESDAVKGWRPNVLKFSLNLLKDIQPRPMTRDIDWGIHVPVEGWENNDNKRLYVWFDAVIGYLSATIEYAKRNGDENLWRKWWNKSYAEEISESYYYMGKDNITFHSQIWPAEILAYNGKGTKGGHPDEFGELSLPTQVVSSEFLSVEGKQFSSSRGVVIYVRDFLQRYQADALRYYIAVAGPETHDSNFTWEDFYRRTNEELIAGWGNLVSRALNLAYKNFGCIPAAYDEFIEKEEAELLEAVKNGFDKCGELLENQKQKDAIRHAMYLVDETNKYISAREPWKIKPQNIEDENEKESAKKRLSTILNTTLQCIFDINIMLSPFLVYSSQQVYEMFGYEGILSPMPTKKDVKDLYDENKEYTIICGDYASCLDWSHHDITSGQTIEKPKPLYKKLDNAMIEEEIELLKKTLQ